MSWPQPIRIVGVGSPHGDDSLGWEIVRRLQEQISLPDCEFYCVDGGQRMLDVLDGRGTLIVIDAVEPKNSPGTIVALRWPDERIAELRAGSTHDMGPSGAMELAEAVNILPPVALIFGIEAESAEPNASLSRVVSNAVVTLTEQITDEILRCTKFHY